MPMLSNLEMKCAILNRGKLSTERLQSAVAALQEIVAAGNGTPAEVEMLEAFETELKLRRV